MATTIGAIVTVGFGVMQLLVGELAFGFANLGTAAIFAAIPLLHRFGELVAPLVFITVAYLSMTFICWHLGTATGIQFYFLIAAAGAVMVVGINRIGIAITAAAIGVSLVIALEFTVASDTGEQPAWTIAAFLDDLYTRLDALVNWHGVEKIKTSGDAYIVVSGVPQQRPDHLEALADLALDIAETVAGLTDSRGCAVPLRIGLASGPVVVGVIGSQRFFYDVWGNAVNVASRRESTVTVGRIQVPQPVYERLRNRFVFEERGDIDVKGKGVMHTWYLVGRRGQHEESTASQQTALGATPPRTTVGR